MTYQGDRLELPLGWGGLTGTHNVSQAQPTELLKATNVTYENGTMQKEGGATLYTPSALAGTPTILGGHDWWPTSAVQRSVALTSLGSILKDTGGGSYSVSLKTGLNSPSKVVDFAEGGQEAAGLNRKLFICTGSNQAQVLSGDGVTTTNLATPPADWAASFPAAMFLHDNHMWGYGGADKHRLYYSTSASHEDFTGAGSGTLAIYPGDGDEISGAISFKGHIIVFKTPFGIYDIDTTDPTVANWTVRRMSKNIGAAGQGLISNTDDDVLFMDKTGVVHTLSAVREYGDFGLISVSDQARMNPFVRDNINLGRLKFGQSVFYMAKREVHFALSAIGSSSNNRRLVVDLNAPPKTRFRFSDRDSCESIWLRRDVNDIPRYSFGDTSGFIWLGDDVTKAKNSLAYEGRFKTPHFDLAWADPTLAARKKNYDFLELIVEPLGNWVVNVDSYIDGKFKQTIQFQTGVNGAALGSFILNTDVLGNDQVLSRIHRIIGSGHRISLEFYNGNAGEDFSIAKAILYFRPAGDEESK